MLNSSINFIIYCFFGSKFRETLLSSFGACEILIQAAPVHSVQAATQNNKQDQDTLVADHEGTEDTKQVKESVILGEEQLPLQISEC